MHTGLNSSSITLSRKNSFFLFLLFSIICISLLSPIASNDYIPTKGDFQPHLSAIAEAKDALEEGQFPIRIAPNLNGGLRYAFFQFYSPLPYTVAAIIYKLGCSNPFVAYKITIWLALMLASFFMFRLITYLTQSIPIAILSSMVYISAPYLLININTRGDFTEVIAQCLLPMVIYFNIKVFQSRFNILMSILAILSWQFLLLTHLLTFIYFSLFIFLFFLLVAYQDAHYLKRFILLVAIYIFTCMLAAWYVIPIALVADKLNVGSQAFSPYSRAWLTPISTLLSPTAVSPMPLSTKNNLLQLPIYCSIGWVILLSIGFNFYLVWQKNISINNAQKKLTKALLFVAIVSIFATWSPIDFWRYLPNKFSIIQFPYRLLTQTMWIGTILFAFAFLYFFNKPDARHVLLGIFLVGLSSSSWLPTNDQGSMPASDFIHNLEKPIITNAYMMNIFLMLKSNTITNLQPQFLSSSNNLKLQKPIFLPTNLFYSHPNQKIIIQADDNNNKLLSELRVQIFGSTSVKVFLNKQNEWEIPIGKLAPRIKNDFFILTLSLPNTNSKSLKIKSLTFSSPEAQTILNETSVRPFCTKKNMQIQCYLKNLLANTFVQLPIIYYPGLLSITVNGNPVNYLPSPSYNDNYVFAGVNLSPGINEINIQFVGIRWANWISLIAFFILIFGLSYYFINKNLLRTKIENFKDKK